MAIQLCGGHWTNLVTTMSKTPLEVKGGGDGDLDDPLTFATHQLASNFMSTLHENLGVDIGKVPEVSDEDASVCPICWLNQHCPCEEEMCGEWWVSYAVQDTLDKFQMV